MDTVWRGRIYTLPFLWIGTFRNIMFPEQGKDVPFTIENFAYVDSFGRETVTEIRTFAFPRIRRFDAYMIRDPARNIIVGYQGTHQHLAVDHVLRVTDVGGLLIESWEQRFYEGPLGFKFPMCFSGKASVHTWFDDSIEKHRIEVEVTNDVWGRLFGFSGSFELEWQHSNTEELPQHVLPKREEPRW